ncbi:unnamed protein product [Prorocentrum cordatum]|uniref:Uncharacterized protein n=1 Tax=Prorocentrum cordatum TaxID=2364126 RepID=A0ABN9XL61_9DINO|nr:unnamed protein product [Polarella glacialis]
MSAGARPDAPDFSGQTAMFYAVQGSSSLPSCSEACRLLLEGRADPEREDLKGLTPVALALRLGSPCAALLAAYSATERARVAQTTPAVVPCPRAVLRLGVRSFRADCLLPAVCLDVIRQLVPRESRMPPHDVQYFSTLAIFAE